MFVAWCLLLLCVGRTVGELALPISNSSEMNCSSLCGILPANADITFRAPRTSSIPTLQNMPWNFFGLCAHESGLSIGNWEKSARRFLQLINMTDERFECPRWSAFYDGSRQAELLKFLSLGSLPLSRGKISHAYALTSRTSVVGHAEIRCHCTVTVNRGVVERNSRVYWMADMLQYGGKPLRTTGSVLSLWLQRKSDHELGMQAYSVHLQQNESSRCRGNNCATYKLMWLPSSTFGTSVPYENGTTKHYSIFAKWNFEQIPGIQGMLGKFHENENHLDNVANELSPSNIAILSLPLLLAIPPISLFEEVSTKTTVLYMLATDILAACPMLIKGIELVIVYPRAKVKMYSTLGMSGEKFGVFEGWYTECNAQVGVTQTVGAILMSVALWSMMASSYSEFAFWRELQYRHGRLSDNGAVNERKPSFSERKTTSWYARNRMFIVAGGFSSVVALFITSMVVKSWVFYIGTIIALVIFRIVGTNRFSQLLRWKFWVGIVCGFRGGPLYLILHEKTKVRESKNWGDVSEGANICMAVLGAACAIGMDLLNTQSDVSYDSPMGIAIQQTFNRTGMGTFFPFHLLFAWIYGSAIIVLHAARSLLSD